MTKAIFGLADDEVQADRIVECLLDANFSNEDISIIYPDKKDRTRIDQEEGYAEDKNRTEKHSKAPEGGVAGATTGGILGGSLGLLAGMGALAIPGLGAFIAAGPIMGALSGSGIGGGVGLLIGTLIGSGIPEYEAKKYETGLKKGNILISVHTDNDDEINRANEIMKREGAQDISSSQEITRSGY